MPETNSNNITLFVNDGTPTVTAHLEFPGPVVLGVVTSYNAISGTVSYNRLYTAGNRTGATDNGLATAYTANQLNQYAAIGADIPSYDADGNMLSCGGWAYTWNGEDRLASATRGTTRLEFRYDYMGRRFEKKVYESNVLVKQQFFVYDGFKQIAEYDALANDALSNTYVWQPAGLDVPLLRNESEFYVSDANKNVVALMDTTGTVTDTYVYDPFGNCAHTGTSDNPFRFSSEFHDDETGLVYYNYRYYDAGIGRWIKRDSVGEKGGISLYLIVWNNTITQWDIAGLLTDGQRIESIVVKKNEIRWGGMFKEEILGKSADDVDFYGHWWIEIDKNESYGWWPDLQLDFKQTVIGVGGDLNGQIAFYGSKTQDPHHGDSSDSSFHPRVDFGGFWGLFQFRTIKYGSGKGKLCKCVTENEIKDGIRDFATSFTGGWSYPLGPNCHTFVNDALRGNCLEE